MGRYLGKVMVAGPNPARGSMDSFISSELYSPHKAEIMEQSFDWIPALLECQENVVEHIRPLLGKVKEPQPDLGRGAGGDQM